MVEVLNREYIRNFFYLINNPVIYRNRYLGLSLFRTAKRRLSLIISYKSDSKAFYPSILYINPTNACNMNCKTCAYAISERLNHDIVYMDFSVFKSFIDDVAKFTPNIGIVGGGEPTLHPKLIDMIKYIKSKGCFCALTTNGILLNKLADELNESGLDTIGISIDGPADVHDKIRGHNGAYKKIIKGLLKLYHTPRRKCFIIISTTLSKLNYLALPRLIDELYSLGAPFDHMIVRQMGHFIGKEALEKHNRKFGKFFYVETNNYSFLDWSDEEISKLYEILQKAAKKPKLYVVTTKINKKELYRYYNCPSEPINPQPAYCAWILAFITEKGKVVYCNEVTNSDGFVMGNINEEKFTNIWNNEKYKYFRKIIKENKYLPICVRCCAYLTPKV